MQKINSSISAEKKSSDFCTKLAKKIGQKNGQNSFFIKKIFLISIYTFLKGKYLKIHHSRPNSNNPSLKVIKHYYTYFMAL
jgi:hypothetical protein